MLVSRASILDLLINSCIAASDHAGQSSDHDHNSFFRRFRRSKEYCRKTILQFAGHFVSILIYFFNQVDKNSVDYIGRNFWHFFAACFFVKSESVNFIDFKGISESYPRNPQSYPQFLRCLIFLILRVFTLNSPYFQSILYFVS